MARHHPLLLLLLIVHPYQRHHYRLWNRINIIILPHIFIFLLGHQPWIIITTILHWYHHLQWHTGCILHNITFMHHQLRITLYPLPILQDDTKHHPHHLPILNQPTKLQTLHPHLLDDTSVLFVSSVSHDRAHWQHICIVIQARYLPISLLQKGLDSWWAIYSVLYRNHSSVK